MDALEYLQTHVPLEYRIRPGRTYTEFSKEKDCRECGLIYVNGKRRKIIVTQNDDGAVADCLPPKHLNNPSILYIIRWMEDKLFNLMIVNASKRNFKTELVRLRIAVNMIFSLDDKILSEAEKIAWTNNVKELYWNRKRALIDWRLMYIDEIPFLINI